MSRLPPLPIAFFDEFGKGADDRVQDYARAAVELAQNRDSASAASARAKMLEGVFCFCGEPSVEFDSWFQWFPCKNHKHLSPIEYSRIKNSTLPGDSEPKS